MNCGLQGSGSPQRAFSFIITYILLFVKSIWRADVMKIIFFNNKDDDNGVIVMVWMGPVAPTLANLLTHYKITYLHLMTLSKSLHLVGKIHFIDNSNHFNTFTLSHVHHHTNHPRHAL